MKKVKTYIKVLAGSFLVAVTLNAFFKGMDIVPSGVLGFSILYNMKTEMDLAIILFLTNALLLLLGVLTLPKRKIKRAILPFIFVPVFLYLTKDIGSLIDFGNADKLLITLYGGVLLGLGFKLIYKENRFATGSDMITEITKEISKAKGNLPNYILDAIWIGFAIKMFGFENAMYSLLAIIIMEYLSKRATLGISDSKVFYIITKKDADVRRYIIDELHYELTIFDVKGGFLKMKNKVLMSVIPTKDYYKLREGIKLIDPKAFISITDSYEVINPNKSVELKESR